MNSSFLVNFYSGTLHSYNHHIISRQFFTIEIIPMFIGNLNVFIKSSKKLFIDVKCLCLALHIMLKSFPNKPTRKKVPYPPPLHIQGVGHPLPLLEDGLKVKIFRSSGF